MSQVILAVEACDPSDVIICTPSSINELFEFREPLFMIGSFPVTRTVLLIFLAALFVIAVLFFGLRSRRLVPTRFGVAVESIVGFVRDDIAIGIIGPEGARFTPWLLSLFLFILVGNSFELVPGINFPITSRVAIPVFLALITYVVFLAVGIKRHGIRYFTGIIWPMYVPWYLRWLVGLIEFVSILFLRPFTLAVRLFANMVAGHLMLTLLLVSGWVFISNAGTIGLKAGIGVAWFGMGLLIFMFEIVVIMLQAYIFTLLSAVYVETSLNPAH